MIASPSNKTIPPRGPRDKPSRLRTAADNVFPTDRRRCNVGRCLLRCVGVLTGTFILSSLKVVLDLPSNPTHHVALGIVDGRLPSNTATTTAATNVVHHDPYVLLRNPPQFTITNTTCSVPPGTGEEGPAGIRGLYKIATGLTRPSSTSLSSLSSSSSSSFTGRGRNRLLCMVYTHSNRHDVVRAIAETYGQQCDGFLAASNVTDPSLGTVRLLEEPESYKNLWTKVRAMWSFVHEQYLPHFDWFLICGDDTYVIPDNVRRLTERYTIVDGNNSQPDQPQLQPQPPLYLGASIPHSKNPKRRFCGGGAGYVLNRPAVKLLVRRMQEGECPNAVASDEDVRVGRCLEDVGVRCHDTNDAIQEVRFHHLDANYHASWVPTKRALWLWKKLQYFHNIQGNQSLLGQISDTTTTFHLDKTTVRTRESDRGIRRYHAILYGLCGTEFDDAVRMAATTRDPLIQARIRQQWEETPKLPR